MAYSKEAYEAAKKYKNEKIKRVPLDMQRKDYDILKAAVDIYGEKVNEFIMKAIHERLERGGLAGYLKLMNPPLLRESLYRYFICRLYSKLAEKTSIFGRFRIY